MPRPPNTDVRRAEIADGLVAALADRSYAATTTADIARHAGLTTGLVHYHFKSKRAVLLFVVEQLAERVMQRFAERAAEVEGARERLLAFVDAYVALGPGADPRAVACWVGIAAEALSDADVRAVYQAEAQRAFDELEALCAAALEEAGADGARGARLAAALWCAMQGSYQVATAAPGLLPRGVMAPALHDVVDAALGAGRARRTTKTRRTA